MNLDFIQQTLETLDDNLSESSQMLSDLEKAKKLYYEMMGWDEDGKPTRAKLWDLNLEWLPEAQ